jgi:hypothetical protein
MQSTLCSILCSINRACTAGNAPDIGAYGMQAGRDDVIFASAPEPPRRVPPMMPARGFQQAAATRAEGRTATGVVGPDGTPAKAEAMT